MGCAFDLFITSWKDCSYVITLVVLCWVVPLIVIFISYNGIIYRVKHSTIRNSGERRKPSFLLHDNSLRHWLSSILHQNLHATPNGSKKVKSITLKDA